MNLFIRDVTPENSYAVLGKESQRPFYYMRGSFRIYRTDVEGCRYEKGLVATVAGIRRPTVAGLLIMGREEILRQHIPAHEVAFQVLEGTDVRVNEFFRKPLLQIIDEVELLFKARIDEQEIQVGLFRVPIPNYDRRAFREAFINALVHRDYSRLGAVHLRLDDDGLTISNPGGFVEGITLHNLLVAAPRSRNPLLADIIKRINPDSVNGLLERSFYIAYRAKKN